MKRHRSPTPSPAHPLRRREPLPWHRPKAILDEPDAERRVRAILESPSYRQADQDVDFLNREETRGVRLQLDYEKAESVMRERGIEHTIVVFGSTRIPEPAAAERRLQEARQALSAEPGDPELSRRVSVAERVLEKSAYYEVARALGRRIGELHRGSGGMRLVLMTGGGPGMMEAAHRGAFDAGAPSVGLNITLPHEQFPNPYITPALCLRFHYFALRKLHFLKRARALVALPGGFGTLDELFCMLTLIQTRKVAPVPVVLVGERFWRRAFDPDFLVEEGVIDAEDRELFWYAETADEIFEGIRKWHDMNGTPLAG
ncbi:LOG family protein [Burkholderiaceae bacterium FT117]|uniref:LOG family protein n=1 Tax=Zeimonas sediminis TaxID=2944268 RepID=UPI00234304B3|nr:LOG family protein [Zeimonas sediminis]MCM5569444.1 LOG family protein [Zeimonas sediminis]